MEFDLNRRTEETFIRPPGTGVSVILPPASKLQIYLGKDKGKSGFVERLVVNAPLRRSCMARVLKGSHRFTCTPRVHRLTEWTIRAFSFPAEAGTHLPNPGGWVRLGPVFRYRVSRLSGVVVVAWRDVRGEYSTHVSAVGRLSRKSSSRTKLATTGHHQITTEHRSTSLSCSAWCQCYEMVAACRCELITICAAASPAFCTRETHR